jgi:hypothetical protein
LEQVISPLFQIELVFGGSSHWSFGLLSSSALTMSRNLIAFSWLDPKMVGFERRIVVRNPSVVETPDHVGEGEEEALTVVTRRVDRQALVLCHQLRPRPVVIGNLHPQKLFSEVRQIRPEKEFPDRFDRDAGWSRTHYPQISPIVS